MPRFSKSVLWVFLCLGCVRKAGQEPETVPVGVKAEEATAHPFGSRPHSYAKGSLLPSDSKSQRDEKVKAFYEQWKEKYLKPGCNPGELVVYSGTKPTNLTVSEAHGYGMIILAYMAGYDPQAQQLFNQMVRYHRAHMSGITSGIMAWYQNTACVDVGGDNGAVDGDLDIAYAFLLADKQWGSCGAVDYLSHAEWVIAAMSRSSFSGDGSYPLLGDWVTPGSPHYNGTRVSDFMGSHFRAFQSVSNDPIWSGILPNTYWVAERVQATASPKTGLLPDFVVGMQTDEPQPATNGFLEGKRDGAYAYNACRIPLRMGTDFLLSGDPRPKRIALRINQFAKQVSGGEPSQLRGGYFLDGEAMVDYETMAFTGPIAVGAMLDPNGQEWLDALWQHSTSRAGEGYYEDTLRMLSLIVLSGNWWGPEKVSPICNAH